MAAQAYLRSAYKFKYQTLNKWITIDFISYISLVAFADTSFLPQRRRAISLKQLIKHFEP